MPPGRIDIHNHLLPGIDDGCRDVDETLTCIRRLMQVGYRGAICTPHIYPPEFPDNTAGNIAEWTQQLREVLREAKLDFQVWAGGEMRLYPGSGMMAWIGKHGMPALGPSRCILVDYWEEEWPESVLADLRWLISHGYRPILAHPERLPPTPDIGAQLGKLAAMGVWFQGNFNCLTGLEGALAGYLVRQFLHAGLYQFLALDIHRPDTLESRLDGVALAEAEVGAEVVEQLAGTGPGELVEGEETNG